MPLLVRFVSWDRHNPEGVCDDMHHRQNVFSQLRPTCHRRDVATIMQWGVIEIIPKDFSMPGILAEVTAIIADNKISVRQAIVDDFELSDEPRLFIVTEKQIPGTLIPKIRKAKGVKAVLIY